MVRIGKTYGNLMVDVQTGSEKLKDRARRIVNIVTGLDYDEAERLLTKAHWNVKAAIVMQKTGLPLPEALARLRKAHDSMREAIGEDIEPRLRGMLQGHAEAAASIDTIRPAPAGVPQPNAERARRSQSPMPDFRAASEVIREAIARRVFPGAVVEVGSPTQPVWQAAFGDADLRRWSRARPTRFDLRPRVAHQGPGHRHGRDAQRRARTPGTRRRRRHASAAVVECRPGRRHDPGSAVALLGPAGSPAALSGRRGRTGLRAGDLRVAAGVRAREPLGLQRSRVHPAREPRGSGARRSRIGSTAFWRRRARARSCSSSRPSGGGRASPRRRSTRGAAACSWARCTTRTVSRWAAWPVTRGSSERRPPSARSRATCFRCSTAGRGAFSRAAAIEFTTRRADVPHSSRALGWDTMLPTSSCGTRMSARAFGHTGFTGTSLWLDPEAGCYVVLLTNRVHPSREGDGIATVRPAFHDAVMEEWRRCKVKAALAAGRGWPEAAAAVAAWWPERTRTGAPGASRTRSWARAPLGLRVLRQAPGRQRLLPHLLAVGAARR